MFEEGNLLLFRPFIFKNGTLYSTVFTELKDCLANSKMVKNKYRKILKK